MYDVALAGNRKLTAPYPSSLQILNFNFPTTNARLPFPMAISFNIHLRHRLLNQLHRLDTNVTSNSPPPQGYTLRIKNILCSLPPSFPHVEFLVNWNVVIGIGPVGFIIRSIGAVP
jgi:hypothetical protein